jgi:ribosomal protein S18 acetylase RimI-like enzyme
MPEPIIRVADRSEEGAVIATVALAFAGDPFARWINPDPERYLAVVPDAVRAFGGRGFDHGSVHVVDRACAVAMWLPPGIEPDGERLAAIFTEHAPLEQLADLESIFEQMDRAHPTEPHWYLPIIAVEPAQQGRGLGAALLRHALARCDADGLPAYLESSNPRNIALYQRHGFEVQGAIQAGSSPRLTPMLRRPR